MTSLPWQGGGELPERFQQRSDMGTLDFRWGVLATVGRAEGKGMRSGKGRLRQWS